MKCPNCGTNNPDGAIFCQGCAFRLSASSTQKQAPSQPQQLSNLPSQSTRTNRSIWIMAVVTLVVGILVVAAVASFFYFFINRRTPDGTVLSWLISAGFGNAEGTADKTIAKAIGGEVYNETRQWYSDFFVQYQGSTGIDASAIHRISNQELDTAQKSAADDAVVLLKNNYALTVKDYCYVHFWLTGLGYYHEKVTVGLLEVGHSWYIGYATSVVDLGNI